ncbi:hypothetical protein HDU76_012313 [Blyttiomyces sp. JEL0837]|nr:hypothetical protein HDU76_012313 [Blyttiomyces sp. JEL0837]
MPTSLWEILPFEIRSLVIKFSDPLTRYINNNLTEQEIGLYGTEIWRIVFKIDYAGDLGQIPPVQFPNFHNGLKLVKSRSMYHRLCEPSYVDWVLLKNVAIDRSKRCECSRDEIFQCWKPMRVCFTFKLLVHIPIINGWMDELPDWWNDIDPFKLYCLASSIGHLDMVKSLTPKVDVFHNRFFLNQAFQEAAKFGYLAIVKFLLDADIGINVSEDSFNAMDYAAGNGHVDVVSFLLDKCIRASLNGADHWYKEGTFQLACKYGHIDVVKILNTVVKADSFKNPDKASTMLCAVESRNVDLIKYLVEEGGFNHEVSCRAALLNAIEIGFLEGVAILAKVDGVDTAAGLLVALDRGYDDIVKMLSGFLGIRNIVGGA